jgi:FAD/FMN-containing dehydrogenase
MAEEKNKESSLIEELTEALGADSVLTGDDVSDRAEGVWSAKPMQAKALLRPRSTEEVSAALAICNRHRQSVIAHGGLSGLVKSQQTTEDDVALSLERMNKIEAINVADRTAEVQAGVVLQTLQEAAEKQDLFYPLDLGGRGSCTIGGNIATNAGGNRVIRYGMTRDMVLGLEVVLADGTVVSSMNHMIKNNTGYDLKHLFIGSEGTLGIVTRAVLRLRERPLEQATVLVAIDAFDKMGRFLKYIDAATGGALSAYEAMWNNFYTLVTTEPSTNRPPLPQDYPHYVLVEAIGVKSDTLENILSDAFEQELIVDAVVAQSETQRLQLWALRDDVMQMGRLGPAFTFDVSLRISCMEEYVAEVNRRLEAEYDNVHNITLGHMGDGNLHFAVAVGEGGPEHRLRVEACVYEPLAEINGSVSAEHGVGLEKKPWLHIARSDEEISLMRMMKRSFDPHGILNPGKIFDA